MRRGVEIARVRILIVPALLFAFSLAVSAQTHPLPPRPDSIRADKGSPSDDSPPMTTIEEEMKKKREIKYAEKEHEENLVRANELVELGKGLATSFKQKKLLDRDDLKRLDRLEKLTRKIRSEAGGEDGDVSLDNPPTDLDSGVCKIEEAATSVGEKYKHTPRQVISASVIDEANVLLELIRRVRSMTH